VQGVGPGEVGRVIKVMTIVGTRPEIIRLSRVITRLDKTVEHILVHTGQNYDYGLNGIFFDELGLRKPDYFLEASTTSLGRLLGEILIRTEELLLRESPDAVLILGDTNSSIASIIAKRMRIPVYHMEAGNRCFDENVPEETNRRLIDHVADFNLVYTEHARRNLLSEGLHPRRILLTGSPMREVLSAYRNQIQASDILERLSLTPGGYFLVSAHREENVDSPTRLRMLLECLVAVREEWGMPVYISTHPRTRKRLEAIPGWIEPAGLTFHEPFGFLDYNQLQLGAACVLSDSGTIAEESTIMGFPAITLRDSIERPEALDTGGIMMTGLDVRDVVEAVRLAIVDKHGRKGAAAVTPVDYLISNTSERVLKFILSTARRHHSWSGTRG
jgi:UDP-N-acetylglucosamine 2-epimerase